MFFRKSSSPNRLADLEQSLRPQSHHNKPHQKQRAQKEHCQEKHSQRKCEAKAFDFNESISLEYDGDSFAASLSYEASEQPYADPETVTSPWNNGGDAPTTPQSLSLEDTSTPLVTEAFHVESFGIAEPQSSYPAYPAAPVADVSTPEIPSPTLSTQAQWEEEAQGLATDNWGEPMPQAPSEYNQSPTMQQPVAEVKSMAVEPPTAQVPPAPATPVIPAVETPVTRQTYTSPTYPTHAQEYPTTISVNAAVVPDSETDISLLSAQSLEDEVGYQYPTQQDQSTSFGSPTPSPVFYDPDEGEVSTATALDDRAADAEAFEADIRAILSGEKSYEPQVSPVAEATAPQPAATSSPNPTPAPAQTAPVSQATSHSVFDQMASVVANPLDVGALSLEQQFSEFDRILDREARPVPVQPTVVPQKTAYASEVEVGDRQHNNEDLQPMVSKAFTVFEEPSCTKVYTQNLSNASDLNETNLAEPFVFLTSSIEKKRLPWFINEILQNNENQLVEDRKNQIMSESRKLLNFDNISLGPSVGDVFQAKNQWIGIRKSLFNFAKFDGLFGFNPNIRINGQFDSETYKKNNKDYSGENAIVFPSYWQLLELLKNRLSEAKIKFDDKIIANEIRGCVNGKPSKNEFINLIFYIMLGTETYRCPRWYVIAMMVLDLISAGKISWDNVFGERKNGKLHYWPPSTLSAVHNSQNPDNDGLATIQEEINVIVAWLNMVAPAAVSLNGNAWDLETVKNAIEFRIVKTDKMCEIQFSPPAKTVPTIDDPKAFPTLAAKPSPELVKSASPSSNPHRNSSNNNNNSTHIQVPTPSFQNPSKKDPKQK
jgi:hypothetical protein